jgi:hypothetical protein
MGSARFHRAHERCAQARAMPVHVEQPAAMWRKQPTVQRAPVEIGLPSNVQSLSLVANRISAVEHCTAMHRTAACAQSGAVECNDGTQSVYVAVRPEERNRIGLGCTTHSGGSHRLS